MFKRIDNIIILLFSFVFFVVIITLYLLMVDRHTQKYYSYNDSISKLQILNKGFNSFLLNKSTFINYDYINKEILSFEKHAQYLDSEPAHKIFPKIYSEKIKQINSLFKIKADSIEYYKSQNSLLLESLHYLFDLNSKINKSRVLNKMSIEITNSTYLNFMKYYVNNTIDEEKINNNINFLRKQLKDNNSFDLEMFIVHVEINLKRINGFNKISKTQKKFLLRNELEDLQIFLDNYYQSNHEIQRYIVMILFIIIVIILSMLIIGYRRSLKMKDELLGFKTAIENSYNSIVITDANKIITYVNDMTLVESGYLREELIGENPRILKSGLNTKAFYKSMNKEISNGKRWEGEFINKRKDGSFYYEKASIMPIFNGKKLVKYLAIKSNITDYIETKKEVEHMAYHDSLTLLPNRANIENYLERRLTVALRKHTKVALLFIDLDRFKNINDTLGHDVGDELLIEVANRLKLVLRKSDMLSRFGGDEFALVIDGFDDNNSITLVCEKIIKYFHKPIQTKQHVLNITLSIGVSIFPQDAKDSTSLFKYSDVAMYNAKNAGKNTYRYYDKEQSVYTRNRFDIEQALKHSITKNEFYMVYQPQYKLNDKSIVGVESLVRWDSESLGLMTPDKFIATCEDIGYILKLGLFIFRQACIDFLIFRQKCQTLKTVSINISVVQLYQDKFIEDIVKIITDVKIRPKDIILEITETQIMKNITYSINVLDKLKEIGFNISIDDFGTGHSSLSYLKSFPINELKIDKSFIENLPNSKDDISIVKAIVTLSNSMEYISVAEGIENVDQEQFLLDSGCQLGQGYYFCRPKTKDELLIFLNL